MSSSPGYSSTNATAVPDELQCLYSQSVCCLERAIKENGERHSLCEYHRDKANAAQRRSAKKRRDENRRQRVLERARAQVASKAMSIDNLLSAASLRTHLNLTELVSHDENDNNEDEVDLDEEDLKWLSEALASLSP